MGRAWGVWATVAWALTMAVWAGPVDVQNLPVEHRGALQDIVSGLPSASEDMFIWNGPDGSYRFGMQGQDQWRVESRDANGHVEGRYVYKTPDGQTVDVSYGAGVQGYRAVGDAIPGGSAPLVENEVQTAPYGALVRAGQASFFPNGNGVTTYTDDDAGAIITYVDPQPQTYEAQPQTFEAQPQTFEPQLQYFEPQPQFHSASAVFPILDIPGTDETIIGPALVNEEPLVPAAIPV